MRLGQVVLFAGFFVSLSRAALADAMPKIYDSWFLPVGLSTAVAIHENAPDGFAGGLELSLVHNDEFFWKGGYADVVRDFASDHTRFSIGPEIGAALLGVDGGYLLDTGKGLTRHGFCVRPMLSIGFVMFYGRVGRLFGDQAETLGEVGFLFKYPFQLSQGENPHRPMPAPEPPSAPPPDQPEYRPVPGPFAQPPPGE